MRDTRERRGRSSARLTVVGTSCARCAPFEASGRCGVTNVDPQAVSAGDAATTHEIWRVGGERPAAAASRSAATRAKP